MGAMVRVILGVFGPCGAFVVGVCLILLVAFTSRGFQEKLSHLDTILLIVGILSLIGAGFLFLLGLFF